ncbi:MAG: LCP family protein [Caldilinea sp.]|nr:LCP family protein [Caldilinea sp.]
MNSAQPHLFWHRTIAILLLLALLTGTLSGCSGPTASAAPVENVVETSAQVSTQAVTQPPAAAPAQRAAATATPMAPASTTAPAVEVAMAAPDDKPLLGTTNILLLGSDRRPEMPNWRTDVMMIVAVDRANNRVGVISLPRDLYIDVIPNHRGNKMNVIDYLGEQDEPDGGGPKLLGQVIEDKIGVPIHHYVRVDFESVKKLVDAMGGVEIDVDCALYDPYGYDEGGSPLALEVGVQRLDGGEALSYVRSRRIGGDLERERRQQRFIWAVRTQILNENLLPRVPAIYQAMQGSVQTDLNLIDAVKLVRMAMDLEKDHVHGFVVNDPSMITAGYAGQMWVWYADWPEIAKAAQDVFNRPALFNESEDGQVQCP